MDFDLATDPEGATVTRLDTQAVLGTTPLHLSLLRQDAELTLRFSLAGHQDVDRVASLQKAFVLQVDLPEVVADKPKAEPSKKRPGKKVSNNATVDPFDN
ncbi:MAG: hypothetical protein H7Z38_16570 [Rubrivivax sp.]|nr:hypothetical protein [Pyrinomonadaceae bacterium]